MTAQCLATCSCLLPARVPQTVTFCASSFQFKNFFLQLWLLYYIILIILIQVLFYKYKIHVWWYGIYELHLYEMCYIKYWTVERKLNIPLHNTEANLEIQALAADRWGKSSLYQLNMMPDELNKQFGVKRKGIVMPPAWMWISVIQFPASTLTYLLFICTETKSQVLCRCNFVDRLLIFRITRSFSIMLQSQLSLSACDIPRILKLILKTKQWSQRRELCL